MIECSVREFASTISKLGEVYTLRLVVTYVEQIFYCCGASHQLLKQKTYIQ